MKMFLLEATAEGFNVYLWFNENERERVFSELTRTVLLLSTAMRQEAADTLVYLFRDKKVQRRPECRAVLEKRSSELLFSSDPKIRRIMIHFMSLNQHEAVALPVERHTEHLSSIYKTQTLEINNTIISHSAECFIGTGMFQRKKVNLVELNYYVKNGVDEILLSMALDTKRESGEFCYSEMVSALR